MENRRHLTRRAFLQTSSGLVAAGFVSSGFALRKQKPLLSFSTLGCPDWTFDSIVSFAADHHYDGIEVRGILREMDLPKCPEFSNPASIRSTMNRMKEKRLKFVNLGSSAHMHSKEAVERQHNLDDAKRFIDLAHQLECPYVRVFPNNFPKDQERNETIDLVAKGLIELGNFSKGSSVKVLMETHGEFVQTVDIEKVMTLANHPQVGLIWDPVNMWTITKEPPADVYQRLKKYIHHTHIKDATMEDGKIHYTLLGKGVTPVFEAVDSLAKGGYKGYYSFEWEKMWHPEIEAPEIALADYPGSMEKHFGSYKL